MNLDLQGRRALVCGASRGIGLAIARQLAAQGCGVVLLARDSEALAAAKDELDRVSSSIGAGHQSLAVDMGNATALRDALAPILEKEPVQIVVNNSGGPAAGPAHAADNESFEKAFAQHLVAAQTIARLAIPAMKDAGFGRFINIISTSVKEPITGLGVSNTIRGAVASWAKTLATELGPAGITVNNVLPGFTDTERLAYLFRNRAEKAGTSYESVRDAALAQVPAGRFAKPEEIAAAVGFLASPDGAYVNGINLPVDGGRTRSL